MAEGQKTPNRVIEDACSHLQLRTDQRYRLPAMTTIDEEITISGEKQKLNRLSRQAVSIQRQPVKPEHFTPNQFRLAQPATLSPLYQLRIKFFAQLE